jgi:hypothetical protein
MEEEICFRRIGRDSIEDGKKPQVAIGLSAWASWGAAVLRPYMTVLGLMDEEAGGG